MLLTDRREQAVRAWLALRMAPWALAVPILKHALPLPRLTRLMWSSHGGGRNPDRERSIAKAAWWASRVQPGRFPDNCLERSLVTYRFLALSGADPRLVLGMKRDETGLTGHTWVTVDGVPVQDPRAWIETFRPLVEFGPNGSPFGSGEDDRAWHELPAGRLPIS
jgi:hypothetical protein